MAYTYSKTDWANGDHVSPVRDGERVRENILAVYDLSLGKFPYYTLPPIVSIDELVQQYPEYSKWTGGGITDRHRYASYYPIAQYNQFETAIQTIADKAYRPPNFYAGQQYTGNTIVPTAIDQNNIEKAIETLHETLQSFGSALVGMPTKLSTEWREF